MAMFCSNNMISSHHTSSSIKLLGKDIIVTVHDYRTSLLHQEENSAITMLTDHLQRYIYNFYSFNFMSCYNYIRFISVIVLYIIYAWLLIMLIKNNNV